MHRFQLLTLSVIGLLAPAALAHPPRPSVSFGIHFGGPVYPRPYCAPGPWVYRPYPYYYYPPAPRVIVHETPVVVTQPAPVLVTTPPPSVAITSPVPSVASTTSTVVRATSGSENPVTSDVITRYLQLLASPEETSRRDAVMELGRLKADRAIEPLAATLAGDRSPVVRDAAARALGLIGSPRSLTVLIHAAQADTDRDVRHSAQFAVEIIQANQRR